MIIIMMQHDKQKVQQKSCLKVLEIEVGIGSFGNFLF